MNGTIDLSSCSQDFSSTAMGGDELKYVDEDDTWSETSNSCSCSSCDTCSVCDICNVEDFRVDAAVENGNTYAEKEFVTQERARLPLSSLQEDKTRKSLLQATRRSNKNIPTKRANNRNCTTNLEDPMEILEPNYVMYSSGSDKEINSSFSSSVNSGIIKNTDSSSEISSTENFNGLPALNTTEKRQKHVKKVTFSEFPSRGKRPLRHLNSPVMVQGQSYGSFSAGSSSKQNLEYSGQNSELSSECIRLQGVLKNIDPFLLRSLMLHQLAKKDSRTILTLGKMFPKKRYPLETIHCVRCHNEYNPLNGRNHCKITHPVNAIERLGQKDQLACYRCGVCKKIYWVNILADDVSQVINHLGYCFVGTHSPTVDDVSFFPVGAAKTCEDMGCIEFYV